MKKILVTLTTLIAVMVGSFAPAFAYNAVQSVCDSSTTASSNSTACQSSSGNDPVSGSNGVISKVVSVFTIVVGFVSVLMIVIAGLEYVTSGGESARVNTAKNTILFAIIGLVIVAIGQILIAFVINKVPST